jgi:hypothetical protein
VTVYLIDENVLREFHSKGNREVRAWYASVAQADLRISAMTFFEKRLGMGTQAEKRSGSCGGEACRIERAGVRLRFTAFTKPRSGSAIAPNTLVSNAQRQALIIPNSQNFE